jgi:hypothetical protein
LDLRCEAWNIDAPDSAVALVDTNRQSLRLANAWQCYQADYRGGGRTDDPAPREFQGSRHVDALHFLLPSGRSAFS